jgi:hypothetical protein
VLLARFRFVIADFTDTKSNWRKEQLLLKELQAFVPNSPKLPVQPIIVKTQEGRACLTPASHTLRS